MSTSKSKKRIKEIDNQINLLEKEKQSVIKDSFNFLESDFKRFKELYDSVVFNATLNISLDYTYDYAGFSKNMYEIDVEIFLQYELYADDIVISVYSDKFENIISQIDEDVIAKNHSEVHRQLKSKKRKLKQFNKYFNKKYGEENFDMFFDIFCELYKNNNQKNN